MGTITVTVAWCAPAGVHVEQACVPDGSSVAEVLRASRLLERFPEIDLNVHRLGIFNRLCEPGTALRDGDRVEIYRPLIADPKTARRRRAADASGGK